MNNIYDITRARGGKDDASVGNDLKGKLEQLSKGGVIQIQLSRIPPWKGTDRIYIREGYVEFIDREDHTYAPVIIKAAIRNLHHHGIRGNFQISVAGDKLTITPGIDKKDANKSDHAIIKEAGSKLPDHIESLWEYALADPLPLFKSHGNNPLLAVFDKRGFFFSEQAQYKYNTLKDLPHIYAARLESENEYYFGISNQPGGRWQRSHYYHLGTLAHEILGTEVKGDQRHSHWVEAWFEKPYKIANIGDHYAIRMKEKVVISFLIYDPPPLDTDLQSAESFLIRDARRKGLAVLNKAG